MDNWTELELKNIKKELEACNKFKSWVDDNINNLNEILCSFELPNDKRSIVLYKQQCLLEIRKTFF